jgi:Calcineurin-like phosphoesterase
MLTIVIGDIHGMAAKLENLLGQIDLWLQMNATIELQQFVFLGDYIDRGPHAREVLQIVQRLQAAGAICLRAITKSSCFALWNPKGTSQIFSPTAATQPLPRCARRPRSNERKNGCARSRPAKKTNFAIMFTRGFVPACPSTSRPSKPNFGFATASFVTRDHSQNTSCTNIRRRYKRRRMSATTAATSIRALE